MHTLNKGIIADTIRTVEHSECLTPEAKERLLNKLRILEGSLCDHQEPCSACALRCSCQRMVEALFAPEGTLAA